MIRRERLTTIVETIILLGQLNIPFRGHRDDVKITDDCSIENKVISEAF